MGEREIVGWTFDEVPPVSAERAGRFDTVSAASDPRPYAGPTDLVTAADVAKWLRERAEALEWYETLADALDVLDARIDRERRQACRRGCFAMFHEARMWRGAEREARGPWGSEYRRCRTQWLSRALAFRAAARQP